MNNPDDIRESVSKTCARAVEQTPGANRACCAGPAPQGFVATLAGYSREALYSACISGAISEAEYLAGLREAGLVDVAVRDRLTYDSSQLAGLLDSEVAGSCCCGSDALPKDQVTRVADALAGKVASIRVVGRKPEEVVA